MWTAHLSHTQNDQCLALCPIDIRNQSNSSLGGVGGVVGEVVSYSKLVRAIDSNLVMES